MKPITERDVARFLEGMIHDRDEADRVLEAILTDPVLGAIADMLGRVDRDEEMEISQSDRHQLPDLAHTRLVRLSAAPPWTEFPDGQTLVTPAEFAQEHQISTFEVRLTRQGNSLFVQGDWPAGLTPIGFVLSQFDLAKGRPPSPPMPVTLPNLKPTVRREPPSTRASGRPFTPAVGKAQTGTGHTENTPQTRKPEIPSAQFSARCTGLKLVITSVLPLTPDGNVVTDEDIVIVELQYRDTGNADQSVREAVELRRVPDLRLATGTISRFPWPTEAGSGEGTLTVRAPNDKDLPFLTDEQVCTLLANDQDFAAVPVLPDAQGRLRAELCYESQQTAAADPNTAWLLRMVQQGGAA